MMTIADKDLNKIDKEADKKVKREDSNKKNRVRNKITL